MNKTLRSLCINSGVTFVTLLLVGLFFESVVFRYILPAAELPRLDTSKAVIKYKPNQKGTYRLRDEIRSDFAINAQGWNSGKIKYSMDKIKPRIAIVGDSYVEALQVATDTSMAEQLERMGNKKYEVYRFGISGAPLSQYLYMLRHEVLPYQPDLVIFNLVHNDFDESWAFMPGAYTSAFLKLKIDGAKVIEEIPPAPFSSTWYAPIRRSNTWRYLSTRQQIRFQRLRSFILDSQSTSSTHQANVDITDLKDKSLRNKTATEYILKKSKALCKKHNARLMVVIDGVRQLIYQNPDGPFDKSKGALTLNVMVDKACARLNIPCIDLHPVFSEHYRNHGQHFEFKFDGHWNELGHKIAAQSIADRLRPHPLAEK